VSLLLVAASEAAAEGAAAIDVPLFTLASLSCGTDTISVSFLLLVAASEAAAAAIDVPLFTLASLSSLFCRIGTISVSLLLLVAASEAAADQHKRKINITQKRKSKINRKGKNYRSSFLLQFLSDI
jgi:membrane protein implicated in regulation of membrane protease activity